MLSTWALLFQGRAGDEILKSLREKRASSWFNVFWIASFCKHLLEGGGQGSEASTEGMRTPKKVNSLLKRSSRLPAQPWMQEEPVWSLQDPAGSLAQGSILT